MEENSKKRDIEELDQVIDEDLELDLEEINLANKKLEVALDLEKKKEVVAAIKDRYTEEEEEEFPDNSQDEDTQGLILDLNIVDDSQETSEQTPADNTEEVNEVTEIVSEQQEDDSSDLDSFFDDLSNAGKIEEVDNPQEEVVIIDEELPDSQEEPVAFSDEPNEQPVIDEVKEKVSEIAEFSEPEETNDVTNVIEVEETAAQEPAPEPVETNDVTNVIEIEETPAPEPVEENIEEQPVVSEETVTETVEPEPIISIKTEPPFKNTASEHPVRPKKKSSQRPLRPDGTPAPKIVPVSRKFLDEKLGILEEKLASLTMSISSELGKELEKIDSQVLEIQKNTSTPATPSGLEEAFKDLQEQLTLQMVQLFDGISLSEDFIDLKNYIDERLGSIPQGEIIQTVPQDNGQLDEKLNHLKNEFMIKLEELKQANALKQDDKGIDQAQLTESLTNSIKEIISDQFLQLVVPQITTQQQAEPEPIIEIKEESEESEKEEKEAPKEETEEITYSFTDIESDFVKTIAALKELNDKIKEPSDEKDNKADFEALSEDISSISKRTNKLILSAEDVQKTLKNHLEEIENSVLELQKSAGNLESYPQQVFNIGARLDVLQQTISNNDRSNKAINDALMYLAQWIDSASKSFEYLKSELEKVQTLENKMDEYTKSNKEIKEMLETILEQSSAKNTSIKKALSIEDKLEMIEHRMAKFEKSINKITSYIEE